MRINGSINAMKTTMKSLAFGFLIFVASSATAEPIRVYVRYLHAALWPRSFAATPDSMTNIYQGTLATNIVIKDGYRTLAPHPFFKVSFGTSSSNVVLGWVTQLGVWRYQPKETNYVRVHAYRMREMTTATNFTQTLQDGDVLFFHGTVD